VSINVDSMGNFRRITLDNGVVRAVFLPELGGKMISLVRRASRGEFLLPPVREYRRATYGAAFEEFDTSGFDECLPTVAECQFLVRPTREQRLRDHGEVWSSPWEYEIAGEELFLFRAWHLFALHLSQEITLAGQRPCHRLRNTEPRRQ